MSEQDGSNFKISLDEEPPEVILSEPRSEPPPSNINRRILFFFTLAVLIFVVGIVAVYWDIKQRVLIVHSTGERETETISKDLESKFSSLALQSAKLKEELEKKVDETLKATEALSTRVKKAEQGLTWLRKTRISKKSLNKEISGVKKEFEPIRSDIQKTDADLKAIDAGIRQELVDLVGSIDKAKKDVIKLQVDIATLDQNKADTAAFDEKLTTDRQNFQQQMDGLNATLLRRISTLQKELNVLKQKISSAAPAPAAPATPTGQGAIEEQDLQ